MEKCDQEDQQKIDAHETAKIIPSESETNVGVTKNDIERTKDKSSEVNEPDKKEIIADKTSKSNNSGKSRPKTAPPTHHQVVVSWKLTVKFIISSEFYLD